MMFRILVPCLVTVAAVVLYQAFVPAPEAEHPVERPADGFIREGASVPQDGPRALPKKSSSDSVLDKKEANDHKIASTLRKWIPTALAEKLSAETLPTKPGVDFTLMSYNVLAQDLLTEHSYMYRNHSPRALLWDYRWKNLYQEITEHNADILCLQEVQNSHLKDFYSKFEELGYSGIFKKRTGYRTDGCAIYYRKSKFRMLEHSFVEYNQGGLVLDRDNIAIVAKFAPLDNAHAEFVVATTHLLYNPKRQDVRLAQTQVLLTEVDRFAYKGWATKKYLPVIITGDFNSEPSSAIYSLLVNGTLRYEHLANRTLLPTKGKFGLAGKVLLSNDLRITDNCQHFGLLAHRAANKTLTRTEELNYIYLRYTNRLLGLPGDLQNHTLFSTGRLSHDLQLKSVFMTRVNNDTVGTTNQDGWILVDYIFYSGVFNDRAKRIVDGKLKLMARYSIPTTEQLKFVKNIPNYALGSDHLSLLAKFKLEY